MGKICISCGGTMQLKTISKKFKIGKKEIEIKGIDAFVCDDCGEVVYTSDEAKMIERLIKAIRIDEGEEIATLNLSETAKILRVSNQTIYNMIGSGRIKAHKVGREWRFFESDIVSYVNANENCKLMAAKGGKIDKDDLAIIDGILSEDN